MQKRNLKHILCFHCANKSHSADVVCATMNMENYTNGRRLRTLAENANRRAAQVVKECPRKEGKNKKVYAQN